MTIPKSEIKQWHGAPTIHVNGEPIPSVAYFCTNPTETRINTMRRSNVNIITWGLGGAAAHCSDIGWKGEDTYDYSKLDEDARLILDNNPNAWLIPRVAACAPNWWLKAHPDHQAVMSTGLTTGPGVGCGAGWSDDPREYAVSQASDKWQRDCEAALSKMVAHIDKSDWGHRCIGLQPNGGVNEWFVSHGHSWPDYGPLALSKFREWLKEKNVEGAATAIPPTPEELSKGNKGGWYDPSIDQRCQNWWRFYHELNCRRMLETFSALKTASENRLLVGGFYGYVGDSYANSEPAAWLYGHHHPLKLVTKHPAVDFLAAPYSYQNRQPGGTPESQIPTAACDLANCFTFTENDLGTFWSVHDESEQAINRTRNTMIRDQGQRIIRRQGFWWMDLLKKDEWYTHPILEELINKLTTLQFKEASNPANQWKPEVAVVLGNDTPFHCKVRHPALYEWVTRPLRTVLHAMGTPMDVIMLDDLNRENLPPYKLFIFLDIPSVTPEQRKMVHSVLKRQKAHAYFHGLPGMINGESMGIEGISEITQFNLKFLVVGHNDEFGRRVTCRFNHFSHPLLKNIPSSTTLGGYPCDAIAYINDPDATILGTKSVKGRPGIGVKKTSAGWTSVYSTFAGAPPAFFRNLAIAAGVHVFTDRDAVVDVSDNLILIHKLGNEPVEVTLHRPWNRAVDQITGEEWDVANGTITLVGEHGKSFLLSSRIL